MNQYLCFIGRLELLPQRKLLKQFTEIRWWNSMSVRRCDPTSLGADPAYLGSRYGPLRISRVWFPFINLIPVLKWRFPVSLNMCFIARLVVGV